MFHLVQHPEGLSGLDLAANRREVSPIIESRPGKVVPYQRINGFHKWSSMVQYSNAICLAGTPRIYTTPKPQKQFRVRDLLQL